MMFVYRHTRLMNYTWLELILEYNSWMEWLQYIMCSGQCAPDTYSHLVDRSVEMSTEWEKCTQLHCRTSVQCSVATKKKKIKKPLTYLYNPPTYKPGPPISPAASFWFEMGDYWIMNWWLWQVYLFVWSCSYICCWSTTPWVTVSACPCIWGAKPCGCTVSGWREKSRRGYVYVASSVSGGE